MIKFFLNNEALINFICFGTFLVTMLLPEMFTKTIQRINGIIFVIAFSTCFLSVIINGLHKGF